MFDLGAVLHELSASWGNKLDELSEGFFRFDIGIKQKDGSGRFQYVYLWMVTDPDNPRDRIYMNSRCGQYTEDLDLYEIMKESGFSRYSTLTIVDDKLADGTPCETVIAQASPYADTINVGLLGDILFEVAINADYVEKKYFGSDSN